MGSRPLLQKRGQKVYGLGWFRDAVASTAKRVATASGNNWVVLGLTIPIPLKPDSILGLPLVARLHLPDAGSPTCVELAAQMLVEILTWFPGRQVALIGDGADAVKGLLGELDRRVTSVGRLRADAESTTRNRPHRSPANGVASPRKGLGCPALARRPGTPTMSGTVRGRGSGRRWRCWPLA